MKLKTFNLIALLVFAMALGVSTFAQDKPAADKAAPKDVPKLFVDDTKHEFGKVKEGDEVKHVFKIKNDGKAELIIYNVSPACGCTASDFTKSLAPGAEGTITLSVKTAGMSGMTERFGLGPFLFADGKFLILNDTGELTLARASTTGFEKLARAKVLRGRDAWAPMALVDGRLLLRDSEQLVCLDVRTSIATHETAAKP